MQKAKSITFNGFTGIDFSTTAKTLNFSGKKNFLGAEEVYGLIKNGNIHPLPALTQNIATKDGRLFVVGTSLYQMATDGLYKLNSSENGFDLVTSASFANFPDYWEVLDFSTKGTQIVQFTVNTDQTNHPSGSNYIAIQEIMGENLYSNLQVEVFAGGTVSKGVYSVTTNTKDTLYVDGLLDYVPGNGDTVKVFSPKNCLVIYDGNTLYTWDGASLSTVRSVGNNAFVKIFNNRCWILQDKKLIFSIPNSVAYFQNSAYAWVSGYIKDCFVNNTNFFVWTTAGTYVAQGTGYTTLNIVKVSEFQATARLYPVTHKDTLFINYEGRLYSFAQGLGTQYNYRLIPDTQSKLFVTPDGVIFGLGHGTTKYGILNIEEVQQRQIVILTNFDNGPITDLKVYNGKIYVIKSGVVYKENGTQNIVFTSNKLGYPNTLFFDYFTLTTAEGEPLTISYFMNDVEYTATQNSYGYLRDYPVKKYSDNIKIKVTSASPIISLSLYTKI